ARIWPTPFITVWESIRKRSSSPPATGPSISSAKARPARTCWLRGLHRMRWMFLGVFCVLAGETAFAASPTVGLLLPRGGQRGTEVAVSFQGANLADAQEILVYYPGIAVKKIDAVAANEVKATLTIAPDCRHGEHAFRIRPP